MFDALFGVDLPLKPQCLDCSLVSDICCLLFRQQHITPNISMSKIIPILCLNITKHSFDAINYEHSHPYFFISQAFVKYSAHSLGNLTNLLFYHLVVASLGLYPCLNSAVPCFMVDKEDVDIIICFLSQE